MTADQYHRVLVSLTAAETEFEHSMADWTVDDRELYRAVRLLRAEVLKRESGHPFPQIGATTALAFVAAGSGAGRVVDIHDEGRSAAAAGTRPIRVMVVDDETSIRMIVRLFFNDTPDIEVVAEAKNGLEAVEAAVAFRPTVILMDLNMPLINGLEAARTILRLYPSSKIVMFTANRDPRNLALALEAGMVGYLNKPAGRNEVIAMVRAAHQGAVRLGELQEVARMG
ncbi:MAG: response regulator transcription factor [Verrucomicrobiota bacterium]